MIRRLVLAAIAILVLSQIPASAWIAQVPAAVGGGPFSLITNTVAQSVDHNNVTSGSIDTSGCSLHCVIIVGIAAYPGGTVPTGVSDSKGNTYTAVAASEAGTGTYTRSWKVFDATVGTGHTFSTTGGSATFPSIAVLVFKDTTSTATVDPGVGAGNHIDTTTSSLAPGSVTPTVNNEVLVSFVQFDGTGTVSINAGLTLVDKMNVNSGVAEGIASAYLIQGTAAAVNATWTLPAVAGAATQILMFKP